MGKIEARKNQLIEQLEKSRELSIANVAELFSISTPSARRLCAQMESENRIKRTHGGIRCIPAKEETYSFDAIDMEFNLEKEAIAKEAIHMVKNRQTLYLEAGTTLKHFALTLAGEIRKGRFSELLVFTNSLVNLEILEPVCKVMLIGGQYRPERRDFCGFLSEKLIRSLRFDICFMGADAVNIEDGIMALDIETARLDELLVKQSAQSVILTNSEKFYKHSLVSYSSIQAISTIVTDAKLDVHQTEMYRAAGVNVVYAQQ
jgi:DeoR/GlpR family transcriptional regulator of sugar metabolism